MVYQAKRAPLGWLLICGLVLMVAGCASPPEDPDVEVEQPTQLPTAEVEVQEAEVETPETEDQPAVTEEPSGAGGESHSQFVDTSRYDDFEIITLLPPDAIPAIDNPTFHTADEADQYYDPDELVMGVVFNGDARAYSVPHLSSHEIVNDEVGGVKIAVTW